MAKKWTKSGPKMNEQLKEKPMKTAETNGKQKKLSQTKKTHQSKSISKKGQVPNSYGILLPRCA